MAKSAKEIAENWIPFGNGNGSVFRMKCVGEIEALVAEREKKAAEEAYNYMNSDEGQPWDWPMPFEEWWQQREAGKGGGVG